MTDLTAPGHAPVRVVRAADPASEAARLADETGGDVATDGAQAERLVRDRVEAGRRAIGGGDDDPGYLARAEAIRAAAAAAPPIDDDDVEELHHLALDLGRALRIRDRTEAKAADALQAKVAASTGVALHPSAVMAAANGVVEAEATLEAAERAVLEHGAPPEAAAPVETRDDPVLRRPHDDFDEAALVRRRASRSAAVIVLVVLALGGVAVAVGAPPLVLGAAAVVAVLAAVGVMARGRRAHHQVDEAGDNLAAVGRAVEESDTGRRLASLSAEGQPDPAAEREAWVERRAALDAARDEAEELLRVARNRWHQLAGADADPHHPDDVVRAHDPQLAYDQRVSLSSPTVRTVAAFHRKVNARWRIMWAGLGFDEPPPPERLDAVLDDLLGEHRSAVAALRRLEEAEARQAAAADVQRPLILVEPASWVAATRLAQLLSSVPPEGDVVIVEREGAEAPAADEADAAAEGAS